MRTAHQALPSTGPRREALREKGQFWTPDWVAEAMVGYVVSGESDSIFDPAVGAGAFFRAAKAVATQIGRRLELLGSELDPGALRQAKETGLTDDDLANVEITDFVLRPPSGPFQAIVANPPYIRHHRLPVDVKAQIRMLGTRLIGRPIDGRAGLHVYFLLRALQLLAKGGRLAFIMPADTCEGVFAPVLWRWVTAHYRLEAVVTFAPEASPFPGVDTNAVVFMIRNAEPQERFVWARCVQPETDRLKAWTLSGFKDKGEADLEIRMRALSEGLSTGLSRPPVAGSPAGATLGDYAKAVRGIATGANEFFFLTAEQAVALEIPSEFLVPAIGRTRDAPGDEITDQTLAALRRAGKPTLLLCLDGRPSEAFPPGVRAYLKRGEALGIPRRTLVATRRPWYKMERRSPPPFLFAYLGRRNARFIRNLAGVVPLTCLLCVYPRERSDPAFLDAFWQLLRHPETLANLSLVGKSYGSGAIKVEPRALERLPLPKTAALDLGEQLANSRSQIQLPFGA